MTIKSAAHAVNSKRNFKMYKFKHLPLNLRTAQTIINKH